MVILKLRDSEPLQVQTRSRFYSVWIVHLLADILIGTASLLYSYYFTGVHPREGNMVV
jgi:hypothetical protein